MNSFTCPSLADLFSTDPSPQVESHLTTCSRCQALLSLRDERFDLSAEEGSSFSLAFGSPSVTPGAIVLVGAPETDELLPAVVVRETDDAMTIVPLSEKTDKAAEWDLFVPRQVLGYEVVAEAWNRGRVLPEQVVDVVAQLPKEHFATLFELIRSAATGSAPPTDAHVGPAVLASADPRLRFQDEESERTHVYWEQTLVLAGAATLGELVAARREELGIEQDELADLSLQRGWLIDLESDAIDPSTLARPVLVSLMRRLRISASLRLGRIAYATILAHRGGDTATGLAFARKRQGVRSSPEDQDPEVFVARFLEDLAKEE